MKDNILIKLSVFSVVGLCVCLLISATQYVLGFPIGGYLFDLIGIFVAYSLLVPLHLWTCSHNEIGGIRRLVVIIAQFELFLSMILIIPIVLAGFVKIIVIFIALQIIHLCLYISKSFVLDESVAKGGAKSDSEILKLSKRARSTPSHSDSKSQNDEE
jgi:hypothetical protein